MINPIWAARPARTWRAIAVGLLIGVGTPEIGGHMGICFSHWDAGVPASMFHRFRKRLAREVGIDLDCMEGYAAYREDGTVKSRGTRSWDDFTDPLVPLLRASDVEASFSPEECWTIKRRLQEIALEIASDQDEGVRRMVLALAEAMARAAFLGERFSWCG